MLKVISYTSLCLLVLTGAGCKKFLDQTPDNRANVSTPEQVSQLLGTAYPQANYMAFAESMTDNVEDKGEGTVWNPNRDPFFFEDVRDDQQDSPEAYWNGCYTAISTANLALEAIEKAGNTDSYKAQRGEALVCRAYAHFMLVTFFSKLYNAGTAGSDPGIPYVTAPETVVFAKYERKTVKDVYANIEKDLLEGLPLISDVTYSVPRYHFNKAAANAFAARFFLFKKDYAKVVTYANKVFPTNNFATSLRPWNTTYRDLTYNELWARYEKASESANLLLVETQSLWGRNFYTTRYGMGPGIKTMLQDPPVTGGTWAFIFQLYSVGQVHFLLPKVYEYFVSSSINAEIGYPYVMVPLFTAEEVLFNRAEAYAQLGKTDSAILDLNAYASRRIVNYSATTHAVTAAKLSAYYGTGGLQTDLVEAVLDWKRIEYVQEGMRWFDILRHNISVTHTPKNEAPVTLPEKMKLFKIPAAAVTAGIKQNPR